MFKWNGKLSLNNNSLINKLMFIHRCNRVSIVRFVMIILGGIMGILAVIMLVVGCLATGSTRHTVYRAWKARVGGRLSCAIVSTNNNLLHIN
jgi:hypothetical protein